MHLRTTHLAVSVLLLVAYVGARWAPLLFEPSASADPRVLPHAYESKACDAAVELAELLEAWEPPRFSLDEALVLSDVDREAVERLREISRCDHTLPLPSPHVFPLHTALRVLDAHAEALHREDRPGEAANMLLDGWRLAQNTSQDTVVGALAGFDSQRRLLERLGEVADDLRSHDGLVAAKAEQLASRYTSPTLRLEAAGGGPEWDAAVREDWRMWAIWTWSEPAARRATTELEAVLAMPSEERLAAAHALAEPGPWWERVTQRDWAARGVQGVAVEAAESLTELERVRDDTLALLWGAAL